MGEYRRVGGLDMWFDEAGSGSPLILVHGGIVGWSDGGIVALLDLGRIASPTLVLVGDDDMVTLEHTNELYRAIPNAQLAVVPGASHLVVMEKPELLNRVVLDFLEHEPAPTMMPFRRSAPDGH